MSFPKRIHEALIRHRKRALALSLVALAVFAWQIDLAKRRGAYRQYHLPSVSALSFPRKPFVYFYYHAGLFPVTTTIRPLVQSAEGALRIVREHGSSLRMTPINGFIWGDWGQILLYFPSAWWNGTTEKIDVRPLHGIAFAAALFLVVASFARLGRPGFGAMLALFAGSSEFQLYQVHRSENVWGWPITTNLLMLALFAPLFFRARPLSRGAVCLMAAVGGAALGSLNHVRPETMSTAIAAAGAFIYYGLRHRRTAAIGLLIFSATLFGVRQTWTSHFLGKIQAAQRTVTMLGGAAYNGPMTRFHVVWHALFCGLGDFGGKYGYAWDDRVAQAYAAPILKQRHGIDSWQPSAAPGAWNPWVFEHREGGRSYLLPLELAPGYSEIMKERILNDIEADPLWFAGVIARRVGRVLARTMPIETRLGSFRLSVPARGWIALGVAALVAFVFGTRWIFPVILFMAAPSLTAVMMYSGRGATNYSIYHFAAAAFVVTASAAWLRVRWKRRAASPGPEPKKTGSRPVRLYKQPWFVCAAIVLLAAAVRAPGLLWGVDLRERVFRQPHPDEVHLSDLASAIRLQDDRMRMPYPRAFALVSGAVAKAAGVPPRAPGEELAIGPAMAGRLTSFACALLSVWLLYAALLRGSGRPDVAAFGAMFLALAPLHATYSHFGTADAMTTLFGLLATVFAVRTVMTGGQWPALACAAAAAGAMSAKFTPFALGPALVAAWALRGDGWRPWAKRAAAMTAVGAIVFLLANGFMYGTDVVAATLKNAKVDNMNVKAHPGLITAPFYAWLTAVGCGAPCAIYAAYGWYKRRTSIWTFDRAVLAVVVPSAIVYLLVISRLAIPYARQALPLVPLVCGLAALGLRDALDAPLFRRRSAAVALIAGVFVYQLAAVASIEIYFINDPRPRYWRYIRYNVKQGESIYRPIFWRPNLNRLEKIKAFDYVSVSEMWSHRFERSQINPIRAPDCDSHLYHQGTEDCRAYRAIARGDGFREVAAFETPPFVPEQMLYQAIWGGYTVFNPAIRLYENLERRTPGSDGDEDTGK